MYIEQYGHEGGMELMQEVIKHDRNNMELAWTLRWLLFLAVMAEVTEKGEKRTVSVKLTVTSQDENERQIKADI